MLNDLFLLAKIKEGDIKAFEKFFKSYYAPLCLYATGITGDKEVAEEIVQDLFYYFWKERQKLPLLRSVKSYLYRAVRNEAIQFREHLNVREKHKDEIMKNASVFSSSDPQENMEYEELEELIKETLRKLPERRLKIFCMHRFQGMKYLEIASALSVSVKTVEAEMTKALQTLRKEIEEYLYIT
ncbi:MAG: RNA polymerase sigma-70 factor [Massilibacteroides sp.]|nr:RNA polymerase sigma-70 factor [Massilibacteroides sp.]MDD3061351.1 RNA polymerase sigma-70 factor [Massilibacteroides sp.]MDD4114647.1 RNA polymerase sigma-70 factor [Massilibacteroides sp.]MDD4659442.1 RNA polymerase sigma-70 factor [Massilibacteroides sp.]